MGIFITKLYQFRRNAKKKIIMEEEAAVRASLNHRDAFILDMGKKLYTVNVDESRALVVKEVGRGELSKSMLDTTAIMMLDNRVEVFMWCCKEASGIERGRERRGKRKLGRGSVWSLGSGFGALRASRWLLGPKRSTGSSTKVIPTSSSASKRRSVRMVKRLQRWRGIFTSGWARRRAQMRKAPPPTRLWSSTTSSTVSQCSTARYRASNRINSSSTSQQASSTSLVVWSLVSPWYSLTSSSRSYTSSAGTRKKKSSWRRRPRCVLP